ncbi:MAG TPA: hypothetical protein EYP63_07860 [Desulfotomaculum sp.]|nr:hypothetical protein [Desulfotomaculum sp.]
MLGDILGWELDAAEPVLKQAGFRLQVTATLAPGRMPEGKRRVVRARRLSNESIELVVVFSRVFNPPPGANEEAI